MWKWLRGPPLMQQQLMTPMYIVLLTHVNRDALQRSKLLKQFLLFMLLSWDVWL